MGDLKSEDLWSEARIPPVTKEEAEKAKADSDGADWQHEDKDYGVDAILKKRKNELRAGKNYMGMSTLSL